jgi:alanine dehydrogenase
MSALDTALKGAQLSKRSLEILVLGEGEVSDLLDLRELLDTLGDGFRALTAGEVNAPERNEIAMPAESFLLSMPGVRPGGQMTVKVVTVFEENHAAGLPSHLATITLYDSSTGACLAFMDGTYITAIRTSASAAVSTRLLARDDAKMLTVLGAGVQGLNHLRVFPLIRDFTEISLGSKHYEDAQALADRHPDVHAVEDFEQAVRSSDVVALATHSADPVIEAGWVQPGTHVTSVGYKPPRGELPRGLLEQSSLFVETRLAFEPTPVGCAELAGLDGAAATEPGEIRPGTPPPAGATATRSRSTRRWATSSRTSSPRRSSTTGHANKRPGAPSSSDNAQPFPCTVAGGKLPHPMARRSPRLAGRRSL